MARTSYIAPCLFGMLHALDEQQQTPQWNALSFEERLGRLVDRERIEQRHRSMTARLRRARLAQQASIEDAHLRAGRGLDRAVFLSLARCDWIGRDHNTQVELLIIDDRGLAPLAGDHLRDLLEILEDRHGRKPTIITSIYRSSTGMNSLVKQR